MRENQRAFFLFNDMGVNCSSRKNLANLGSFAKVSVPIESIIPWPVQGIIDYTGMETWQIFFVLKTAKIF